MVICVDWTAKTTLESSIAFFRKSSCSLQRLINSKQTWCTFLLQVSTQGGIKALCSFSFSEAPCHKFCVRCWIITQIHIFMPISLLSAANLSAGKKEKGKHLVSFVTSEQIGVEKGRAGDGCVSLCGLLRAIVLSYLLETARTVAACSGRPCLFVFDLPRAPRSALGPQVKMHGFRIKAGRLALITHLGMVGLLLVRNHYSVSVHIWSKTGPNGLTWSMPSLGFFHTCSVWTWCQSFYLSCCIRTTKGHENCGVRGYIDHITCPPPTPIK